MLGRFNRLMGRFRALTRSQALLLLAAVIVLGGALAAVLAFLLQEPRSPIGPMPAAALRLPSDIHYVAGIDVQRFAESPLYSRFTNSLSFAPEALKNLQAETGIDVRRDLTHVLFAGESPRNAMTSIVVLVLRPGHALERWLVRQDLRRYEHQGRQIYILATKPVPRVAALLADDTVVLGMPDQVEHAVAERARSATPLRQNDALTALVGGLRADAPLWIAYQVTATSPTEGLSPELAKAIAGVRAVTITGELQPALRLHFTATTDTPDAARQLAAAISEIGALALYAAQQNPALLQLVRSVSATQQEQHVLLDATIPYAILDGFASNVATARPTS